MKSYKFLKHHIVFEYLDSDSTLSLNPLVIGYERCESTKGVIGPLTRTRYVFQYVFKGNGTLTVANKTYKIGKDTLFFLPVENVSYAPNKSDPWEYLWIEFTGLHASNLLKTAKLSAQNPIFRPKDPDEFFGVFADMIEDCVTNKQRKYYQYACAASLMKIFYFIIKQQNEGASTAKGKEENKILPIVQYIEAHYFENDLSLKKISEKFFFSPPYLSRIFKKVMNISPSKYIIELRIKKAQEMLQSNCFKISTIAYACGYSSPYYFSLEFKRAVGISPSKYQPVAIE